MTLGELATSEQVAPPTMTRIIEKLSALGYVSRQVDPADRRVSHVTVTAAGRRYFESTRQRRRSWLAARMERLDHDQRARLVDALDVLELLGAVDAEPGAPAALVAEGQAR